MNKFSTRKMILSALLALALMLSAMPGAMAATGFKAVVTGGGASVYAVRAPHQRLGTVPAGTVVQVEAVSGSAALISAGGKQAVCRVSDLQKVDTGSSAAADVITTRATRVYSRASTSSAYVSVKAGTAMKLISISGECAKVSRNGVVGYTLKSHLGSPGSAIETTPARPADTGADIGTGTNEEIIVKFLMAVMGYNRAAACGVAANIKYESGYKVTEVGDSGTSYGICQWHASRKTRLINWCKNNGYDYKTLKGQLYFLQYELTAHYPKVHSYLLSVSNNAQGAYDAGYYFCYHFEAPAARTSQSTKRANYAKSTLYARYA